MSTNDHQTAYQQVLDTAFTYINSWRSPLKEETLAFVEPLSESRMVKMMTLMPYGVADLVPTAVPHLQQLALAHLYIAWYYHAQDDLIDSQAEGGVILGAHLALLQAVETYKQLGLMDTPIWPEFWRLTQLSAETYAIEATSHFTHLYELTPERIAPFTTGFTINRLAPIFFNTIAQLYLAGIPSTAALYNKVLTALRAIYISLQLGDDITDWFTDLQAGQLNVVAAGLIRDLYAQRPQTTAADLTFEGLAGYRITAADYWIQLEHTITSLNQQALDLLADVEPCYLRTALLEPHITQMAQLWPAQRAQQRLFQEIFGQTST